VVALARHRGIEEDPAMVRSGVAVFAAALVLLAAPAAASAGDLFVSKGGNDGNPCTSGQPCLTVARGITAANPGDVVHIGPGTFDEVGLNTAKRITLEGAGSGTASDASGATVIDGSPNQGLRMTGGGAVHNLRLIGGTSSTPSGLELETPGPAVSYDVSGVIAFGGNCSSCRALLVEDTAFGDPSLLVANVADSTFISTNDITTSAFVQSANANFTRTALEQQTAGAGGLLMELGTLTFTDGSIGTPGLAGGAAQVGVGAHATFTRTRFAGFNGLRLDGSMAPVDARVNDSVAVGTELGVSVLFGATLTARGSTFVAEGPDAEAGVQLQAGVGGDATVSSSNSIFRANGGTAPGGDFDVQLSNASAHTSTFAADHSSYSTVDSSGGGTATPPGSATNVAGDPGFANEAGGDFHLSAVSALIDRGAPALAGETDLDGAARALDGNCDGTSLPDIGAFELAVRCPVKPGAQLPVMSKVRMTHRRFRVGTPGAARAPRGTRFLYTLSDIAKVTITIERRVSGRKKGRRCVKPRRGLHRRCTRYVRRGAIRHASAAGQSSVPFSGRLGRHRLAPGSYQARLVAVGAGGRSKQHRLNFTIVRR
jgi:hypothetical protein